MVLRYNIWRYNIVVMNKCVLLTWLSRHMRYFRLYRKKLERVIVTLTIVVFFNFDEMNQFCIHVVIQTKNGHLERYIVYVLQRQKEECITFRGLTARWRNSCHGLLVQNCYKPIMSFWRSTLDLSGPFWLKVQNPVRLLNYAGSGWRFLGRTGFCA